MLIPQSMAYAELAGLAPQFGFYAVIGALVVYTLVGTSRHLGVGPEPGTAILAATGVGALAGGEPGRYVALMAALALVVAGICIAGAVARLGFLASLLSKPVLVGYITGVGLTLLSSQIAGFTGVTTTGDKFFPRFRELFTDLGDVDGATLALAIGTLALILVLKRTTPRGFPVRCWAWSRHGNRGRVRARRTRHRARSARSRRGLPVPGIPRRVDQRSRSPAAGRGGDRTGRLQRQRPHRPRHRRRPWLPDRRQPGVVGAGPDEPVVGAVARVSRSRRAPAAPRCPPHSAARRNWCR